MGTESYPKKGQTSKKDHATKQQGREHYLDRFTPPPAMGSGPDGFDRRFTNSYRKTTLPGAKPESE